MQLDDFTDAPHVNPEFQTGGAHQSGQGAVAKIVLHLLPRFSSKRTVMNAEFEVGRHGLKSSRERFGLASTVDKEQARRLFSQQIAQMPVGSVLLG